MKAAEDYYQEAADNWDAANQADPSDNYPLEPFVISAMRRYARDVAQDALNRAAKEAGFYPRISDSGPERINPYTITATEIITP